MRDRVGEQRLLGFERDVLGRVVEPAARDLLDLVAQQVDLAGPGAGVAAERARARRRARATAARALAVARERVERGRAGEPVERAALDRGIEQRLVRVLAVQVDERAPGLGELRHRRQAAVDVGAAAAVARHDTRRARVSSPVSGSHEAALDPRLGRAVAHEAGVGAAADEQLERLDEQGLARAGLAGDRGEPAPSDQVEVGDDPEVHDVQLDQHPPSTGRRGRTWPSGSGGSRGART